MHNNGSGQAKAENSPLAWFWVVTFTSRWTRFSAISRKLINRSRKKWYHWICLVAPVILICNKSIFAQINFLTFWPFDLCISQDNPFIFEDSVVLLSRGPRKSHTVVGFFIFLFSIFLGLGVMEFRLTRLLHLVRRKAEVIGLSLICNNNKEKSAMV